MNSTDRIFYIMGLVLLGGLVMVEILAAAGVLTLTDLGFSCSFLSVTGLYCPGCGGLLFLVFVVWNSLCTVVNKKTGGRKLPFFHFHTAWVYIGLAILLIQWIVKNVLLFV